MTQSIWMKVGHNLEKFRPSCEWCLNDFSERMDELYNYDGEPVCRDCLENEDWYDESDY